MAKKLPATSEAPKDKLARPAVVDRAHAEIISQPSVRVMTKWTPRHLYSLELSADGGDLWRLADLCDQMIADDRFGTLLETLADGLLGSDLTFEKDDTTSIGTADKEAEIKLDWPRAYARDELSSLVVWMVLLGVAFGKHEHWVETETGRVVPRFRTWHPKHFRYDWTLRTWQVREADGTLTPITAGDGTWVIVTRRGEYRPWATGLWRGLARWWLLKSYAISDWGIHSEKSSKLILHSDDTVTAQDRKALAQELFDAAKDAIISLPLGFTLDLVELSTNTRDIYQAQVEAAEMAASISILGQNLSTRVDGGSYAAAQTHSKKENARVRYLAGGLSTALRDQSLSWWASYNFSDEKLAPYPFWHTDPPEDKGIKVQSLGVFATALVALKSIGLSIPIAKIEEVYGFDGIEEVSHEDQKAAVDAQQPTPAPPQLPQGGVANTHGKVLPFGKKPAAVGGGGAKLTLASDFNPADAPGFIRGQVYADAIVDASVKEMSKACEGFVGRIMQAVDDAEDYESARAAILQAFADEEDPDKIAEIVEAGIVMANLAGRHAVQEDAGLADTSEPPP